MRVRYFTGGSRKQVHNRWHRMRMHAIRLCLDPCPRRHDPGDWQWFGLAGIIEIRTCNRCCRIVEMRTPPAVS